MSAGGLEHIRFGYGLTGAALPALSGADLQFALLGPDKMATRFARATSQDRLAAVHAFVGQRNRDPQSKLTQSMQKTLRQTHSEDFKAALARAVAAPVGFRERLAAFWADHFTVAAQNTRVATLVGPFHDEAIRPHLAGPFSQMLFAASTHPAMLLYLDQQNSVGPNAKLSRDGQGLNENLAREILELHSLGVGASYSQGDVTEFAKLLTGLRVTPGGMRYQAGLAEPGAKAVLGVLYGGASSLDQIRAALVDIALKPETAQHLAHKLVTHFITDTPDPALVARMAEAYLASGGSLMALYEVMLASSDAWQADLRKIKQPFDFIVSSGRAIGVTADQVMGLDRKQFGAAVVRPLTRMGQKPFEPRGPDGWPEEADAWVTPAMLAARIDWSARVAEELAGKVDPRRLLEAVLPGLASDDLRFAVNGTESGWEGVALILASPQFNRR